MSGSVETQLAVLQQQFTGLENSMGDRFDAMQRSNDAGHAAVTSRLEGVENQLSRGRETFLTKDVFEARMKPVQLLVYGQAGLMLTALVSAIIASQLLGAASYGG